MNSDQMKMNANTSDSRPKVLLVDDSQTIRAAAQSILGDAYDVQMAEDGFAAIAKLSKFNPDIIFIDIVMPRLDGYDTVTLLRTNPLFASTPVIMMSSRGGAFDVAKGRLVGCTDYIIKPFDADAIESAIKRYLPSSFATSSNNV